MAAALAPPTPKRGGCLPLGGPARRQTCRRAPFGVCALDASLLGFRTDDVLLVTGASGGIGRAVLAGARASGLPCVAVARRALPETAAERVVQADVSTAAGAEQALAATVAHFGRAPSLLCHAAGAARLGTLERTSDEDWDALRRSNLDSAFFTLRAWRRCMGRTPGAAVLFSSAAARMGTTSHVAVAAAKAGVEGLVRAAAADLAAHGGRVNALALALVDTPLSAAWLGSERARQSVAAQYPLGRYGEAGEVAAQALWLLSRSSTWITGQVLPVDGGFSAIRPLVRS
jgi:NAD(P)-dependent dehydrogenase (short-subunit alcohol dehydrogenase family)